MTDYNEGDLQDLIKAFDKSSVDEIRPPLLLNTSCRDYNSKEGKWLEHWDFETRLFFRFFSHGMNKAVHLRTRHTDSATYTTNLKGVLSYFEATTHTTKEHSVAKINLARLMSTYVLSSKDEVDPSKYYSFATTLASGLAEYGENITFEVKNDKGEEGLIHKSQQKLARQKMCILMDIIFTKKKAKRYLMNDNNNSSLNVFRIAFCGEGMGTLWTAAVFSFLMQVCLSSYVILENYTTKFGSFNYKMIPIATMTFLYSLMSAINYCQDTREAYNTLYRRKFSALQMMDTFINAILPFILTASGFLLILNQDSFSEAVLNATALLFILELDDQLTSLVGTPQDVVIQRYLMNQALDDFDKVVQWSEEKISRKFYNAYTGASNMYNRFSDYYLTNMVEQASCKEDDILYTPHEIGSGGSGSADVFIPSSFVTRNCLIRSIKWKYSPESKYSTNPRIAYLRIEKLDGEVMERGDTHMTSVIPYQKEGLYVITSIRMTGDFVEKLRVCGSPSAKDFLRAIDYYSLWAITPGAMRDINRLGEKSQTSKDENPRNETDDESIGTCYRELGGSMDSDASSTMTEIRKEVDDRMLGNFESKV